MHLFLVTLKPNRVVDICGAVCVLGYAALAWYSRGMTWAPELPGFLRLAGLGLTTDGCRVRVLLATT